MTIRLVRRWVPLVVSLGLLAIMVGYTPWRQVWATWQLLSPRVIVLLFGLSLMYYSLKVARFWYMLRALQIYQPLGTVALSYLSAQPISLLPAGEIYRTRTLQRHTGVNMRDSMPTFTMQGLFEGIGMAVVGIVSALAIGELRIPILALAVLVLASVVAVQAGYLRYFLRLMNRLPFISISRQYMQRFSKANQIMLSRQWLPLLLSISVITEITGGGIAYVAAHNLGSHINVFQAMLIYIVPLVAGFISLLPGGFGVAEQSTIGLLVLADASVAVAVATTLAIRITIVGLGLAYGIIAMAIAYWQELKGRHLSIDETG